LKIIREEIKSCERIYSIREKIVRERKKEKKKIPSKQKRRRENPLTLINNDDLLINATDIEKEFLEGVLVGRKQFAKRACFSNALNDKGGEGKKEEIVAKL
jgi:hypothetical protein